MPSEDLPDLFEHLRQAPPIFRWLWISSTISTFLVLIISLQHVTVMIGVARGVRRAEQYVFLPVLAGVYLKIFLFFPLTSILSWTSLILIRFALMFQLLLHLYEVGCLLWFWDLMTDFLNGPEEACKVLRLATSLTPASVRQLAVAATRIASNDLTPDPHSIMNLFSTCDSSGTPVSPTKFCQQLIECPSGNVEDETEKDLLKGPIGRTSPEPLDDNEVMTTDDDQQISGCSSNSKQMQNKIPPILITPISRRRENDTSHKRTRFIGQQEKTEEEVLEWSEYLQNVKLGPYMVLIFWPFRWVPWLNRIRSFSKRDLWMSHVLVAQYGIFALLAVLSHLISQQFVLIFQIMSFCSLVVGMYGLLILYRATSRLVPRDECQLEWKFAAIKIAVFIIKGSELLLRYTPIVHGQPAPYEKDVMAHVWTDILINLSCFPLTIIAAFAYSADDVSRRYSHFHKCRSGMLVTLLADLRSPNNDTTVSNAVDDVAVRIRACTPTGERRRIQTPGSGRFSFAVLSS